MREHAEPDPSTFSLVHSMAKHDTPEGVDVPDSVSGLIVWAVGRFGIGVIFLFMVWQQYRDQGALVDRMMKALENRAVADLQIAKAITDSSSILSALREEIRSSHDRASGRATASKP